MWTAQSQAISDLRSLLSDNATDKYAYRKKCFGLTNGTNKSFKTFERRRVTDFTTSVAPLAVFNNGSAVTVTADDILFGEFTLTTAPVDGDTIEASYYYQWFLDSEILQFITNATQWLGLGTDPTVVPDGLIPAALHYGAKEGYTKLASFWATRLSQSYLVEDMPDGESKQAIDSWLKLAEAFEKQATNFRDDFYKRQGQSLAPNFAVIGGAVRDYMPKR